MAPPNQNEKQAILDEQVELQAANEFVEILDDVLKIKNEELKAIKDKKKKKKIKLLIDDLMRLNGQAMGDYAFHKGRDNFKDKETWKKKNEKLQNYHLDLDRKKEQVEKKFVFTDAIEDPNFRELIKESGGLEKADSEITREDLRGIKKIIAASQAVSNIKGIKYLSGLTYLDLRHNNLNGNIPSEIGELKNLIYLSLHSNQLSGNIPLEIGELENLTELYLYSNQLSGNIPSEIGELKNLTVLDLHSNNLNGNIPLEIDELKNLTYLSLYSNQLSGNIPLEIGELENLTELYLYSNQLSGNIPSKIGELKNLTWLSLYSNQLTKIPESIVNMTKLTNLNIAGNNLQGAIPFLPQSLEKVLLGNNPGLNSFDQFSAILKLKVLTCDRIDLSKLNSKAINVLGTKQKIHIKKLKTIQRKEFVGNISLYIKNDQTFLHDDGRIMSSSKSNFRSAAPTDLAKYYECYEDYQFTPRKNVVIEKDHLKQAFPTESLHKKILGNKKQITFKELIEIPDLEVPADVEKFEIGLGLMTGLKKLDLSKTSITKIPKQIYDLINLKTLILPTGISEIINHDKTVIILPNEIKNAKKIIMRFKKDRSFTIEIDGGKRFFLNENNQLEEALDWYKMIDKIKSKLNYKTDRRSQGLKIANNFFTFTDSTRDEFMPDKNNIFYVEGHYVRIIIGIKRLAPSSYKFFIKDKSSSEIISFDKKEDFERYITNRKSKIEAIEGKKEKIMLKIIKDFGGNDFNSDLKIGVSGFKLDWSSYKSSFDHINEVIKIENHHMGTTITIDLLKTPRLYQLSNDENNQKITFNNKALLEKYILKRYNELKEIREEKQKIVREKIKELDPHYLVDIFEKLKNLTDTKKFPKIEDVDFYPYNFDIRRDLLDWQSKDVFLMINKDIGIIFGISLMKPYKLIIYDFNEFIDQGVLKIISGNSKEDLKKYIAKGFDRLKEVKEKKQKIIMQKIKKIDPQYQGNIFDNKNNKPVKINNIDFMPDFSEKSIFEEENIKQNLLDWSLKDIFWMRSKRKINRQNIKFGISLKEPYQLVIKENLFADPTSLAGNNKKALEKYIASKLEEYNGKSKE